MGAVPEAGGWLAGHVSNGRIRALPPEFCHALWMGPSLEYTRQWLAGSNRRGDQLTGELAGTEVMALLAPAAASVGMALAAGTGGRLGRDADAPVPKRSRRRCAP
jgi:hypothetical protein